MRKGERHFFSEQHKNIQYKNGARSAPYGNCRLSHAEKEEPGKK